MIHILLKIVTSMASLMLMANLLAGVHVNNWTTAFVAVLVMSLINALLRPVLGLLTLPINFLSFGLFTFVLNAALFALAAYVVPGFEVNGFISALMGSIIFGLISTLLMWILEWVVKPATPREV
jgi:putative membrane protein